MDTSSIITGTTLNRYQLDIPSCTASLDVEEFSGAEKLSELYYYTITFTSAEKNIDAAQLLSKPAMLTMGGGALQQLADELPPAAYEQRCHELLTQQMGRCAQHFEMLPILKDTPEGKLLYNTIYSGVWSKYALVRKHREAQRHD